MIMQCNYFIEIKMNTKWFGGRLTIPISNEDQDGNTCRHCIYARLVNVFNRCIWLCKSQTSELSQFLPCVNVKFRH